MAGVSGSFEGLLKVELAGDVLADALADVEPRRSHVGADDLVLPCHPLSLSSVKILEKEREGARREKEKTLARRRGERRSSGGSWKNLERESWRF